MKTLQCNETRNYATVSITIILNCCTFCSSHCRLSFKRTIEIETPPEPRHACRIHARDNVRNGIAINVEIMKKKKRNNTLLNDIGRRHSAYDAQRLNVPM